MKNEKYIIGIDLHGTLLNPKWEIEAELLPELIEAINRVRGFCKVVLCTGNDLSFVDEVVPKEVRDLLDGYVLETGCSISEDGETEESIVEEETETMIKDLEAKLRQATEDEEFPEVKYFGKRQATISMFTVDKGEGLHPNVILDRVVNLVNKLGYADQVFVTRSDVAVDIIPAGHNKMTGLKKMANGLKTIGIADSLNDRALIKEADHSYVPANASKDLINEFKDSINVCTQKNTRGVIEALNHIADNLK